jgi:hypothetical protein
MPTFPEEGVREGAVTVGVNRHGEVCQIVKLGGREVGMRWSCLGVGVAEGRAKVLDELVRRRVAYRKPIMQASNFLFHFQDDHLIGEPRLNCGSWKLKSEDDE